MPLRAPTPSQTPSASPTGSPGPAPAGRLSETFLAIIIVLQIVGWIALVLVLKPETFSRRADTRHLVVERAYGVPDPQEAQHLVVTSRTTVEVNGERLQYHPQDETDAVEYAANYVATNRAATVVIRKSIIVRAGPQGWGTGASP